VEGPQTGRSASEASVTGLRQYSDLGRVEVVIAFPAKRLRDELASALTTHPVAKGLAELAAAHRS